MSYIQFNSFFAISSPVLLIIISIQALFCTYKELDALCINVVCVTIVEKGDAKMGTIIMAT